MGIRIFESKIRDTIFKSLTNKGCSVLGSEFLGLDKKPWALAAGQESFATGSKRWNEYLPGAIDRAYKYTLGSGQSRAGKLANHGAG